MVKLATLAPAGEVNPKAEYADIVEGLTESEVLFVTMPSRTRQ